MELSVLERLKGHTYNRENSLSVFLSCFDPILLILVGNEGIYQIFNFGQILLPTMELLALERLKNYLSTLH